MTNTLINKELYLKDFIFNLKSASTGKYSVHESYRDNYTNGFLININAPQDVNNALKDIYYATDRGLVISYKDFNNKIISVRKSLMLKNFPHLELKDLSKEERTKIDVGSAKQVLKDLFINESTKLIYSPELTLDKLEAESLDLRIKYVPEEFKVVFYESEDKEKEQIVNDYLKFSDIVKPLTENALRSYNLDQVELTIITINNYFGNLATNAQENNDILAFYNSKIEELNNFVQEIKDRQNELEIELNKKVSEIIVNSDFKSIKSTINLIEDEFSKDYKVYNDPKSKSIKDLAVNQLKNVGKVVVLVSLQDWIENNFISADHLLKENLTLELENLLKQKREHEEAKRNIEEQKLLEIIIDNGNEIYQKFIELVSKKDLFNKLFTLIIKKDFEKINSLIDNSDDYSSFIILLSNNLSVENAEKLWKNLFESLSSKITSRKFPYNSINSNFIKNIYFDLINQSATNEIMDEVFSNIKGNVLLNIENSLLAKILVKLSQFDFNIENLLKKLVPDKLLKLIKTDSIKNNDYVKSHIIRVLAKWLQGLDSNSNEFKDILLNYPEQAIYNLKNIQVEQLSLEDVSEILEKLKDNADIIKYFILRVGKEKFDQTIKFKLKKMTMDEPDNFENHYNLGLSHFKAENFDDAIDEFKKSIGINPESHIAHYTLGYIYDRKKNYDLAISEYKKAINLKYGYIDAYYHLGLIYLNQKDYYLATQQFKKIIKIDPENYDAVVNLGIAFDELKEFTQAKSEYEKAILINPKKSEAYVNLAIMIANQGNIEEAIEIYLKALEFDGKSSILNYNLGLLYHQQKNYTFATAHYKTSLKFDSKNSQTYNNLGLVYFSKIKVSKAMDLWRTSIEIDNNIDAYNNLGWGYYIEGELDKAIETYKEAQKIAPTFSTLYLNLGTVYYK
ncbi:MAG: tetratricopeptide repeat protein, partial [Candidatus Sericytochromatia bacterium]|nr:tetratricopeptide repeat protein [Candidatus Sericytochromatia bacterium]